MLKKVETYKPISCSFYDIIEASATLKKLVQIRYFNIDEEEVLECNANIVDVYTEGKEEFVALSNGTIIRLDHIISIDSEKVEKYENCTTKPILPK